MKINTVETYCSINELSSLGFYIVFSVVFSAKQQQQQKTTTVKPNTALGNLVFLWSQHTLAVPAVQYF